MRPNEPSSKPAFPDAFLPDSPTRVWVLRVLRLVAALVIVSACAVTGSTYLWLKNLGVFQLDENRLLSLQNYSFADNTIVFDRDGKTIGEFFSRYQVFVPIDELPPHLVQAILAIEDRTFREHPGIDFSAIVRATWSRLRHGRITQGASTITQQVTRHLLLNADRTIERKLLEIAWSLKVEKTISKDQILQIYTNSMFLGNGAYGVGAAALRYFGKDVRELNEAEAALIAGLFQSPSRYNPAKYPERARTRQLAVITAMTDAGYITPSQAGKVRRTPLVYKDYKPANYETAPWFVDSVREELSVVLGKIADDIDGKGLRVHTSLDSRLQAFAEKSVASATPNLTHIEQRTGVITDSQTGERRPAKLEAAMLVTDPHTGDILAMVGSRNYQISQFNRTTSAMRSPGSAFKPVVYTEALMRGRNWSDVMYVSPINVENYRPRTPDDDYLSETTMLRAFYRSMNTPTVEIASQIGIQPIIARAKSLGIRTPIKQEFGSSLGSSDTTMMDLARMYGVFANQGTLTELNIITSVTTAEGKVLYQSPALKARSKQVLTPQIAYLMTQGMRSVLSHGTASKSADLAPFTAGKTGTSNNAEDNWFCGYSSNLTAIVWVGTDEHAPILANVNASALALPIWDVFMRQAFTVRPPIPEQEPPGLASTTIHPLYGHRVSGGLKTWFLDGSLPQQTASALENIRSKNSGEYRRVFSH